MAFKTGGVNITGFEMFDKDGDASRDYVKYINKPWRVRACTSVSVRACVYVSVCMYVCVCVCV